MRSSRAPTSSSTRIRRPRRGFSLLEVIVAVSILVLIAGAAIPLVSVTVERAKRDDTRDELNALKAAIEDFFRDVEEPHLYLNSLDDLVMEPAGVTGWVGPYLSLPLPPHASIAPLAGQDAWNEDYRFAPRLDKLRVEHGLITITSSGPDRKRKTDEDNLVITVALDPVRRKLTLDELKTVNAAILAWPDDPADPGDDLTSVDWYLKLGLPQDLLRDAWGDLYVPDVIVAGKVIHVTSPNL